MSETPITIERVIKAKSTIKEIDLTTAMQLFDQQAAVFIDVRELDEWQMGHIPDAYHIPRSELEDNIEQVVSDFNQSIVIYCAAGGRSALATEKLQQLGYTDCVSMEAGMKGWHQNNLPIQQ